MPPEVEQLIAMADNADDLIAELARWKYEVAKIVWPFRKLVVDDAEFPYGKETYGDWFERVFYESLTDYQARAKRDKIGESFGKAETRKQS